MQDGDNIAPEGQIWVCGACGRSTKDRSDLSFEWDESCFLNSVLCYDFDPSKGWIAVTNKQRERGDQREWLI